jgi:hypothetical protein
MALSRSQLIALKESGTRAVLPADIASRRKLLEGLVGRVIVVKDSKKGLAGGTVEKSNNICCYPLKTNGSSKLHRYEDLVELYFNPQKI